MVPEHERRGSRATRDTGVRLFWAGTLTGEGGRGTGRLRTSRQPRDDCSAAARGTRRKAEAGGYRPHAGAAV
jgi:hypothetical protein